MIRLEQFDSKHYTFPHTYLKSEHERSECFDSKYDTFQIFWLETQYLFHVFDANKILCECFGLEITLFKCVGPKLDTFQMLWVEIRYF